MAKTLQLRRGTSAEMAAFVGQSGEPTMNMTTKTLHLHDGITPGGFPLPSGEGWQTLRREKITSAIPLIDILLPPDYSLFRLELWDVAVSLDATFLGLRTSTNGGTSFASGSSDYLNTAITSNVDDGDADTTNGFQSSIGLNGAGQPVNTYTRVRGTISPGVSTNNTLIELDLAYVIQIGGVNKARISKFTSRQANVARVNALRLFATGGQFAGQLLLEGRR